MYPGTRSVYSLAESISEKTGGYLVKIEFFQKTEKLGSCYTAFDVVNCWTEAPRYGFLSSFSEEDKQKEEYQEFFREMHLNVIQFYDWMYRMMSFIRRVIFTQISWEEKVR